MNEFFVKGKYEMLRSWEWRGEEHRKMVYLGFARYIKAESADAAKEKVISAVRGRMGVDDRSTKCLSFNVTEVAVYERVA